MAYTLHKLIPIAGKQGFIDMASYVKIALIQPLDGVILDGVTSATVRFLASLRSWPHLPKQSGSGLNIPSLLW